MERLFADRRLFVTKDRGRIAENGHPDGAFLLYAAGKVIGAGDIELYGLEADSFGRVTYDGAPALPDGEPDRVSVAKLLAAKAVADGDGDSDRNNEAVPEWTQRTSPEAYLERYPEGPNAELARDVIAANAGADGEA